MNVFPNRCQNRDSIRESNSIPKKSKSFTAGSAFLPRDRDRPVTVPSPISIEKYLALKSIFLYMKQIFLALIGTIFDSIQTKTLI